MNRGFSLVARMAVLPLPLAAADNKPDLEIIRRVRQEATRNTKVMDLWVAENPSQPNRSRPIKGCGER